MSEWFFCRGPLGTRTGEGVISDRLGNPLVPAQKYSCPTLAQSPPGISLFLSHPKHEEPDNKAKKLWEAPHKGPHRQRGILAGWGSTLVEISSLTLHSTHLAKGVASTMF